ncbi:hypothetical protein [Streptomyces sp. Agncl-13]|uniref:hypothetical protein n=1 Tax=Streptomyces sp. Agncl-13 TaxID=3400628 RepID=UPI003A87B010
MPLVSLGPAFASLVGGWRRTTRIGGFALLLTLLLGWYDDLFDARRGFMSVASVIGVTAAGLVAVSMRRRREAELDNMRSVAEAAQRVLLKPMLRLVGKFCAAISYTFAVTEARRRTDLRDAFRLGRSRSPGMRRVRVPAKAD